MRVLARTWQMLLKGIAEVNAAGRPLAAAEMVLVRIAYAADLPTPDEVIRSHPQAATQSSRPGKAGGTAATIERSELSVRSPLSQSGAISLRAGPLAAAALAPARVPTAPVSEPEAGPLPRVAGRFEELIALAAEKRDLAVKVALERDVRLVRCEDGRLEIGLEPSAAKTLVNDLARKFSQWTNRRWMVAVSTEEGEPTIKVQKEARQAELKTGVRADPLVQAVLARFPGAEIVDVREGEMTEPPLGEGEGDEGFLESTPDDDGSPVDGRPDEG
jgi:DNA polymerase III subunit gamma/tau